MSNTCSMHPKRSHVTSPVDCNFCDPTTSVTISNHRCNYRKRGYNNGGSMSYDQSAIMEFNDMSMHQHQNFHSQSVQPSNQISNRQPFHQIHSSGSLRPPKIHIYREEEKNYADRYKNNQQFMKGKIYSSENNPNVLINNSPCPSSMCNNTQTQISYSYNSNPNHPTIPISFSGNRNPIDTAMTGEYSLLFHIFKFDVYKELPIDLISIVYILNIISCKRRKGQTY